METIKIGDQVWSIDNLNNDCKIYVPDKGCEDLIIPERFTNVSR